MSDLQLILIILGLLAAVMQLALAGMAIAMSRNGGRVTLGMFWGIAAAILFIAAVLVG